MLDGLHLSGTFDWCCGVLTYRERRWNKEGNCWTPVCWLRWHRGRIRR